MQGRFSRSNLGPAVLAALLFASSLAAASAASSADVAPVDSDVVVSAAAPAAVRAGAVDPHKQISVDVMLPSADPAGLDRYAAGVIDPASPLYDRFMSPEQFAASFGASVRDADAITAWATAHQLEVTDESMDRSLIAMTGQASQIEKAFGVTFYDYTAPNGAQYFDADRSPSMPVSLAARVDCVIGMSNYARLKPQFEVLSPALRAAESTDGDAQPNFGYGHGHYDAYDARDLNIGYSMPGGAFDGKGETVAVYEDGGFFAKDIAEYQSYNHLPAISVIDRNVNGYGGAVDNLDTATEAALDIDMERAIAPSAKRILVYEDGDSFDTSLLNVLAAVADDNETPTLSISYGLDELIQGGVQIHAEARLLTRLTVQGISVLAAAGDRGVAGDLGFGKNVIDPGAQPLVTCVGGTTLYENLNSAYLGEQTWNDLAVGEGATGGGISRYWPIKSYQLVGGATSVASANGGSATRRNIPDVAAVGDPFTGADVYATQYGGWVPIGGTSLSTPIWAGYLTLVEQARREAGLPRLGLANIGLYAIGTNSYLSPYDYNDIIGGDNGNLALYREAGFFAGFGYDNVTGFGSMVGNQMLTDLASTPSSSIAPPATPVDLAAVPGDGQARVHWPADPGATGYFVYSVDPASGAISPIGATEGLEFTVTGLINGRPYEFYLAAVDAGGSTYAAEPVYVVPGA